MQANFFGGGVHNCLSQKLYYVVDTNNRDLYYHTERVYSFFFFILNVSRIVCPIGIICRLDSVARFEVFNLMR